MSETAIPGGASTAVAVGQGGSAACSGGERARTWHRGRRGRGRPLHATTLHQQCAAHTPPSADIKPKCVASQYAIFISHFSVYFKVKVPK